MPYFAFALSVLCNAPAGRGDVGLGLSLGFFTPSLSHYNRLLDSLGENTFDQGRILSTHIKFSIAKETRLVLGVGQWIYDLPFTQPLSQRLPYERWTVQLVPITVSVETGFTLPASIVKPLLGIGAGCCLIDETTYIYQKSVQYGSTSTFIWHLYLGSEVVVQKAIMIHITFRQQFGSYAAVFGEGDEGCHTIGIGGSTVSVGINFYFSDK